MRLTDDQLKDYEGDGYVLLPGIFTAAEIDLLKREIAMLFAKESEGRVLETDGRTVRSIHGSHTSSQLLARLVRDPRLIVPARQIVGTAVHVYQFKVNAKAAFAGDVWEWHQDFIFWQNEDGMPAPRVTNVVVFLDEVNEFNGPLLFIPGSQLRGVIDVQGQSAVPESYAQSPEWISNLTADLKYSLGRDCIAELVSQFGIAAPKGRPGSMLVFHPNVVHGSAPNMSPFDRNVVIVTYNSVENRLAAVPDPRPEFIASRDYTPVVAVAAGQLGSDA